MSFAKARRFASGDEHYPMKADRWAILPMHEE